MLIGSGNLLLGDMFDRMAELPDASADMILADLPYGTTACAWDAVLPFDRLWAEYWRIAKHNAAVVLTAAQPFTTALISSGAGAFRYCWVWDKVSITGFANAKKQPLRHLEDVCVFYRANPTYAPQGLIPARIVRKNSPTVGGASVRGDFKKSGGSLRTPGLERVQEFTGFPRQLLTFPRDGAKVHPTQKPVALFEYLIRTYTNPGDLVLDNTSGSGTTAIAAEQSGRRWVCIERDPEYYWRSYARIHDHLS